MNEQLRIVTIRIANVEGGGVRAWSDDLAGLSLTCANHEVLFAETAAQDRNSSRATGLPQQDRSGDPSVCRRGNGNLRPAGFSILALVACRNGMSWSHWFSSRGLS